MQNFADNLYERKLRNASCNKSLAERKGNTTTRGPSISRLLFVGLTSMKLRARSSASPAAPTSRLSLLCTATTSSATSAIDATDRRLGPAAPAPAAVGSGADREAAPLALKAAAAEKAAAAAEEERRRRRWLLGRGQRPPKPTAGEEARVEVKLGTFMADLMNRVCRGQTRQSDHRRNILFSWNLLSSLSNFGCPVICEIPREYKKMNAVHCSQETYRFGRLCSLIIGMRASIQPDIESRHVRVREATKTRKYASIRVDADSATVQ